LRYLDDGPEVDVLFTDINLEGRMDGSTLAKQVRERRPDLPIVYCSGRYSPSALAPMMSRSIFLKKPYDPNELCMLLARLTSAQQ
jgi:DNA-binding LytR/AlgR family response regulator